MSRSNQTEVSNVQHISTRWIEYSGDEGVFQYYDKEKKEKVVIGSKIQFIYLDSTFCIAGYSKKASSGVYSNEVMSLDDVLNVRFFKDQNLSFSGKWSDVREQAASYGIKLHKNLYIAYKNDDGILSIGVIQLKGSAFAAWSDFISELGGLSKEQIAEYKLSEKKIPHRVTLAGIKRCEEVSVKCTQHGTGKNGKTVFRFPIFEESEISEETNKSAIELDRQLQEYLSSALGRNVSQSAERPSESTDEKAGEAVRFEEKKKLSIASPNFATLLQNVVNKETTVSDITAKYDVDEKALNMLNTAANNSFDDGLEEEEDGDLPF